MLYFGSERSVCLTPIHFCCRAIMQLSQKNAGENLAEI